MIRSSVLCLAVLFLPATDGHSAGLAGRKPNIVLVITDDQGMGDLSCMGNGVVKTPNIDIYPTFAVMAGAKLPGEMQELDGRSLLPLLVNEDLPKIKEQPLHVRYEKQLADKGIPAWEPESLR